MDSSLFRDVADSLINIQAIKFGEFKLRLHESNPDAPLSPIYIDLRLIRSYPSLFSKIIEVYLSIIKPINFDLIADVPTAATPISSVLSYVLKKPMISPRLEKKHHGLNNVIDGYYTHNQTVLLIDDLITKADSKIRVINLLKDEGLSIHDIVILLDREQGGISSIQKLGIKCHVGFRLNDLLDYYHSSNLIDTNDYNRSIHYLKLNNG